MQPCTTNKAVCLYVHLSIHTFCSSMNYGYRKLHLYSVPTVALRSSCAIELAKILHPKTKVGINLLADPLGQPTDTASSDHYFRTCCPSVRPHFSDLAKQNNRKQWSLLARVWVWSSGSLMTPVLVILILIVLVKNREQSRKVKQIYTYIAHAKYIIKLIS